MDDQFESTIRDAIESDASLTEIAALLREWRDRGLSSEVAASVLEELRVKLDIDDEDRVLEVLDLVTGFCAPHLRVWERSE